ncbi:hypothetical protein [Haloechinothrix halophila]|uniref:hypothetical protein n=1 Tax=Haloechinothrix halophila TaxID=1069073 RepID=UPI0004235B28|nr:hypothetical protein [Haloechinothrix halophila]
MTDDLSHLSSKELTDRATEAIIDADADALDAVAEELKLRSDKDRKDGSAFQRIAAEHRAKWQRSRSG